MKFPRNARIFRGQLDAAPFAAVFFLLVIFVMLSSLVYTPGVALQLPLADNLPGTDKPGVSVAVDANGRLYFENQLIGEEALLSRLRTIVQGRSPMPVLIVQADKAATQEMLVRLVMLAKRAGIAEAWLAALPRPLEATRSPPGP